MPKDNVLTLTLSGSNLVFTRYLYIKDEVKIVLLLSILNKSDDAIFWAYELYYSGFKYELIDFIWQIYYDFFATLNPSFAAYLAKKLSKGLEDRLISSIIQNLLIRPFNTDVFLLRTISECFVSEEEEEAEVDIASYLLVGDYRQLASHILNKEQRLEEQIEIYKSALNYFKLTNCQRLVKELETMLNNCTSVSRKIILLANILSLINTETQTKGQLKGQIKGQIKGKNFYVKVDPEEIIQYETIEASEDLPTYKILRLGCICNIADQHFLNLFQSIRNKYVSKLEEKYNEKWLYHASFSPLWFDRIKLYKGYVDYEHQSIKFVDEDLEEAFHNAHNLEPDEQPQYIKDKALKLTIDKPLWQDFFATFKKNGLIDTLTDEIDALNEEPLKY
jgi:hypothetical protein